MTYFEETYPGVIHEIDKGKRTFFRFIGNHIVIGRKASGKRWIMEGAYSRGTNLYKSRYYTCDKVKFTEIFITEIVALEGSVPFNATPLRVDGEEDWYLLIFVLPLLRQDVKVIQESHEEDIFGAYINQIALHEMNHVLIDDCVTETGELNALKSEILADMFLIKELASHPCHQQHLDIKRRDIRTILARDNWDGYGYYRLYLEVIDRLLMLPSPDTIIAVASQLQIDLSPHWGRTHDELYDYCLSAIGSSARK